MARSPLICPVTIGREEELRLLDASLARARSGQGGVVLLAGAAGVGKTRVARELRNRAASQAVRVVEGRCSSAESSVPYAPFMDALRFRIASGESEVAARMLGPLRAVLAPLFPQLNQSNDVVERPPERPFELILNVLQRLSTDDAMLLVLEDIHWADPTSLELLPYLSMRVSSLRLLILATYRSDEVHATHPLRQQLAALARDRSAEEIALRPLDRIGTAEMLRCILGAPPERDFAEAIWKRTEGNPFFIEELLSGLTSEGATTAEALARVQLPATVREAMLARVRALEPQENGPQALETLSAAAVIGRRVDADVLREVLGVPEEQLVRSLEQLVAHQLLCEEPREHGDCYAFPHALLQEALYTNIISRRRRLLHRSVAIAFEQRAGRRTSTRLEELAYHFRLGGDHERAYEYALRAGDEAARLRAWDDAAIQYERALEGLEELADDGPRAGEVLERLADTAWRQDRRATCRQYAEDAYRLFSGLGHWEPATRMLRRLAALRAQQGDVAGAESALTEALSLLRDHPDSHELSRAYDDLGGLALDRGELLTAEEYLLRGLSLAMHDSEGTEEVLALVSLGELAILSGDIEAGVARLDLASVRVREGQLPFERMSRVYLSAVRALLLAHEYERALQWANDGRVACLKQGIPVLDALLRAFRAAIITIMGGAEDTLEEARSAAAALRDADGRDLREALRVLGFTERMRGDLGAARRAYQEAQALGAREAPIGLALVALAEGKAADAASVLRPELHAIPGGEFRSSHRILPYLVEALIGIGDVEHAAELIRGIHEPADARVGFAELQHARGLLWFAEGRFEDARRALTEAADAWSALGNRLDGARARVMVLEAVIAAGDAREAAGYGRELLADVEAMALPREHQRVRRALRRIGVRTTAGSKEPAAGEDPLSPLTTREHAVLREVAEGCTNREIAQALGISEKTVGVHVSHILAKLGCRTRTQAARFAKT